MIRAKNLSKYYGGKRALGPVSFEINDGETVGFLGRNGAGKTTALRILACDLRPSGGTIEVGGVDVIGDPHEVRKRIGFLPENPPLYGDMIVADYLRFAGELRGMSRAEVAKRLPDVYDLTDIGDVEHELISTLSHGYRQRVGVAQAIIHQPKFLILDEPTRGLDPVQIVEMRKLLKTLKQKHTVLISSHILHEISQTCDRLLVLGHGKILGMGPEDELTKEGEIRQVTVTVRVADDGVAKVTALLKGVDGVTDVAEPFVQAGGRSFVLSTTKDCRAAISRAVVGGDLDLLRLDYSRGELEALFMRLSGGSDASN
jgi:ABC-2 type transport system ATP-binding protein